MLDDIDAITDVDVVVKGQFASSMGSKPLLSGSPFTATAVQSSPSG